MFPEYFYDQAYISLCFPGDASGKEPSCQCRRHETWVRSLGWEDPLEEDRATHSSILAWRIPTDIRAWWAVVYSVAKSWTRLSNLAHMHVPLLSSTKNSSTSTPTRWEMRMLGEKKGFSEEKWLSQNCPLNICLIGNKEGCCWLSIILAVSVNGIIYYWITLFANACKTPSPKLNK